jgi:hypothetical protein
MIPGAGCRVRSSRRVSIWCSMGTVMPARRGIVRFALIVVLVAGCASSGLPPEALKRWVGRPAATLQKDWGPATREVPDGELRILVYEEVEQRTSKSGFDNQDPSRPRGGTTYQAAHDAANEAYHTPKVYVRSYLFWVNREGTIVNSAVRTP